MIKKQKVRFIVNPFSGSNKKDKIPQTINDNIDHSKFDYEIIFTKAAGHATELTQNAIAENVDIVVACGGDGTVNEVAKALVGTNVSLGILPSGSGNGFAMNAGWGRNAKRAVQKLNTAEVKCIDTCTVNEHFFLNLAGVGFDALIAFMAHKGTKRGFTMYFSSVVKEVFNFKAQQFYVTLPTEQVNGKFTTIAVANASMYGYNFSVAPQAEMDDGLMDVVFIKEASIFRTLISSWRMLNNTLHKSTLVDIKKCNELTITSAVPYYFHIDGESYTFDKPLNFKIIPKSINALFPINR